MFTTQATQVEGPVMTRPAFVTWQAGGRQEFPVDPIADAQRERYLRTAGLIKTRRIPKGAAINLN